MKKIFNFLEFFGYETAKNTVLRDFLEISKKIREGVHINEMKNSY